MTTHVWRCRVSGDAERGGPARAVAWVWPREGRKLGHGQWVSQEDSMLSERSQAPRATSCTVLLTRTLAGAGAAGEEAGCRGRSGGRP